MRGHDYRLQPIGDHRRRHPQMGRHRPRERSQPAEHGSYLLVVGVIGLAIGLYLLLRARRVAGTGLGPNLTLARARRAVP